MALPQSNQTKTDTTVRLIYNGRSGGSIWSRGSKDISGQIKNFKDALPEPLIYEYNPVKFGSAFKAIVGYKPPTDVTFSTHFDFMELGALSQDIQATWTIIKSDRVRDEATNITKFNTKIYTGVLTSPTYTDTTNGVNVEQNYIMMPRIISLQIGTAIGRGQEIYRYDNGKVTVFGNLVGI